MRKKTFDRMTTIYETAKWPERKEPRPGAYETLPGRRKDLIDELLKERDGQPNDLAAVRNSLREHYTHPGNNPSQMLWEDEHAANQSITAHKREITVDELEAEQAASGVTRPNTEMEAFLKPDYTLSKPKPRSI